MSNAAFGSNLCLNWLCGLVTCLSYTLPFRALWQLLPAAVITVYCSSLSSAAASSHLLRILSAAVCRQHLVLFHFQWNCGGKLSFQGWVSKTSSMSIGSRKKKYSLFQSYKAFINSIIAFIDLYDLMNPLLVQRII